MAEDTGTAPKCQRCGSTRDVLQMGSERGYYIWCVHEIGIKGTSDEQSTTVEGEAPASAASVDRPRGEAVHRAGDVRVLDGADSTSSCPPEVTAHARALAKQVGSRYCQKVLLGRDGVEAIAPIIAAALLAATREANIGAAHNAALMREYAERWKATKDQLAAAEAKALKADEWADTVTRGKSPCGHWKCYAHTEDGGKLIQCWQCRAEAAEAKADAAQEEIRRIQQLARCFRLEDARSRA